MKIKIIVLLISILLIFNSIKANSSEFVNHRSNIQSILHNLKNLNPQDVRPLGNSGMYKLVIDGDKYISSNNGQYLVIYNDVLEVFDQGSVINKPNNYSLSEKTFFLINSINKDNLIVYNPEKIENTIYVLMDYTCPFCQKFHKTIKKEFIENNYRVIYLPFRRTNSDLLFDNNKNIFCLTNNSKKQTIYNQIIYQNNLENDIPECDKGDYYSFIERILFSINENMITPLIIGENGIIIEGLRDFKDYHKILNSNKE